MYVFVDSALFPEECIACQNNKDKLKRIKFKERDSNGELKLLYEMYICFECYTALGKAMCGE